MRLPKHATGFWDADSDPFPEVDLDALTLAVRRSAEPSGVRLERVDRAVYGRSFHTFRLVSPTCRYDLICGRHLAWIAFCEPATPDFTSFDVVHALIDPPAWADRLTGLGYRVLPLAELRKPSSEVDTSELTPAARREAKYWAPVHMAEYLFNYWD